MWTICGSSRAVLGAAIACCVMALLFIVAPPADAAPSDRIIAEARQMLGRDYVNPTFNCSDYTRLVYGRAVGVWMDDWDDQQRFYGWHPQHRKRGDLVFFREHRGDGPVTHVAVFAGKVNGVPYIYHNSVYWGYVLKAPLHNVDGYRPGLTRRIR